MATSALGSPSWSSDDRRSGRLLVELLFTREERSAHPIERIVSATAVSGLFGLDPSAHRVEGAIGEGDHVKGIDHLGALGKITE